MDLTSLTTFLLDLLENIGFSKEHRELATEKILKVSLLDSAVHLIKDSDELAKIQAGDIEIEKLYAYLIEHYGQKVVMETLSANVHSQLLLYLQAYNLTTDQQNIVESLLEKSHIFDAVEAANSILDLFHI